MHYSYKYSIIIPHYNIPDLLGRCLRSIPERDDIQVIVVDDNSPGSDKYKVTIPELSRSNVEFYVTPNNRGGGAARNQGLQYVKGEKLLFADADDFFVDNFGDMLDRYSKTNYDLIYFNVKSVMSDDISKPANRSKKKLFDEYYELDDINVIKSKYTEPWGKIYKFSVIKENDILFDETPVANDVMFSLKASYCSENVKVVNDVMYVLTAREGSVSYLGVDTLDKLCVRLDVMSRAQLYLSSKGIEPVPMVVFKLMVNLSHMNFRLFLKYLASFHAQGIPVGKLLYQILTLRVLSPSKREKINVKVSTYNT